MTGQILEALGAPPVGEFAGVGRKPFLSSRLGCFMISTYGILEAAARGPLL